MLATNSIRGGVNRQVLQRIKESGDIFMAWSDRAWILDGAAVRVSMVGFSSEAAENPVLDGLAVASINPDLTSSVDITVAKHLVENESIQYEGTKKGADFDIEESVAQNMIKAVNASGLSNREVIHPWINGMDIVRRPSNKWIIDFGVNMPLEQAQKYELPFAHVEEKVKPRYGEIRRLWWLHERTRPDMRLALAPLKRFIATARVSKYRIFVWVQASTIPDSAVVSIARDDDYFFGVLHSRLHERWSLRMGTSLEDRPRYTPTTTFETFPFPWSPGHEDTASPAYQAVAAAARQLHDERQSWLTGAENSRHRTLTNLYNALNVHRGLETIRLQPEAAAFAPRLHQLHTALDHAVCAAYGWPPEILADEDEILSRLLALNLQRAT